ncbi:MAG TPA: hypothetical protein VGC41_08855, partial [Kofleriaceae bacterium]
MGRALAVVVVLARTARADDPDLSTCKDVPKGTVVRIDDSAVLVADKVIVLPSVGDREKRCEVYPLAKVASKATGRFVGGAKTAVALLYPGCTVEDCPVLVAMRGAKGNVLSVYRATGATNLDPLVAPLKMRPDRDDLVVRRRSTAGARAYDETLTVLAIEATAITHVLDVATGHYEGVIAAEARDGAKPKCPTGSLKVETIDAARSVFRVVEPDHDLEMHGGVGSVPAR